MSGYERLLPLVGLATLLMWGCGDDGAAGAVSSADSGNLDAAGDAGPLPDAAAPDAANPTCDDACNDGQACTDDECVDGVCVHTWDESLCCTSDQCDIDGACFDDGETNPENPCQICRVAADADAFVADDNAVCDDEDACTTNDRCEDGECVGDARICQDDNPCTDDSCNAATGECAFVNNTANCDDGDACTAGDVCVDGSCVSGDPADCDDGNLCTSDSCDPASGCLNVPEDGISCADVDACTEAAECQSGFCVVTEELDCDDNDVCTADFCDSADGCGHRSLDDLCADDNPCTDEECDPVDGCIYPFNTNDCDDQNLCTTGDVCTDGACLGTMVDPDDGNICTDDVCLPSMGVMNTPNTLPCDDGNMCTVGDTCGGGSCQPGGTALTCNDNNVCTDDSCDPASGCVFENNTDDCDDGDMCTQNDQCGAGTCGGSPVNCDDGNDCTADSCDSVTGCLNTVIQSFACRPTIAVTYPPRGATIQDTNPVVTVTGTVASGAGPIVSFTINGTDVPVDPDTGAFTFDHPADYGFNPLVFLATDELGTEVERVQAYHWSTSYTKPDVAVPGSGAVNPGAALWLSQQTVDDGQAPPPTDLAAIFRQVLLGFDLGGLFDPNEVVTSVGAIGVNFDIYITSLGFGDAVVSLQAIDGGLRLNASLLDIAGRIFIDCTSGVIACFFAGGDNPGDITIEEVNVQADILIGVNPDNTLNVSVTNQNTTVTGGDISSDGGFQDFLLTVATALFLDVEATLATELNDVLDSVLAPLLRDALSALALSFSFDLPRLDGATDGMGQPITIPVSLATDFAYTDFRDATPGPHGGEIGLRAWATTPTSAIAYDNLGVAMRNGCGDGQPLIVPADSPLEVVLAYDTLNQVLRAAWEGGLLEFPVDASLLGDVDLGMFGVSNLNMTVSALLPPYIGDCAGDGLRLYVGDLRIDASLDLFGQPLNVVVYTDFDAPVSIDAANGEITITVQAVENVELEVNVVEEALLASEQAIADLLATELVPALGDLLGGGTPLFSFPLPEIDLSSAVGLPPGTLLIQIDTTGTGTFDGNVVVDGRLQ